MVRHADSLILVWKLAEFEAWQLRDHEIKPAHFLLGLLKIVEVDLFASLKTGKTMGEILLSSFRARSGDEALAADRR